MNYLSVENVTKAYGADLLFEGISFGIQKGQKVALIARNGTGKTTLLRILAGTEKPDSGEVIYRNGIRTGYLEQEQVMDPEKTVREVVMDPSDPVNRALKEYEETISRTTDPEKIQKAFDKMEEYQAWDREARLKQVLNSLKVGDLDKKVEHLSGGEKKRVGLARVLIDEPDMMILDEPTNHLDLDMIEWLEEHLKNKNVTLLLVTHDRYFLDNICDRIVELEDRTIHAYKGGYQDYVVQKAEREAVEQAKVEKARNLMRKEKEWMNRMPKARGTKAKSRQDAYYELKEQAKGKKEEEELQFDVKVERLGAKVLEVHNLKKTIGGKKLIEGFDHVFKKKERVGVIGPNGSGKTTFLNIMAGKEQLDQGKIVHGETLKIGYYEQGGMSFKKDQRVIEAIKDIAEVIPLEKGKEVTAAQFLERFNFPRKKHYQRIEELSGGEKRRLYLITVLMKNPNFLILDEPTNDLDIHTRVALEEHLQRFPGCLVVVSHDRFFMDKLVDHLFVFKGKGMIKDFPGNYTRFREEVRKEPKVGKDTSGKKEKNKPERKNKGLGYKDKRELQKLEKEIDKLESEKGSLQAELSSGDLKEEELRERSERIGEIIDDIEEKTERWMELAEKAEG